MDTHNQEFDNDIEEVDPDEVLKDSDKTEKEDEEEEEDEELARMEAEILKKKAKLAKKRKLESQENSSLSSLKRSSRTSTPTPSQILRNQQLKELGYEITGVGNQLNDPKLAYEFEKMQEEARRANDNKSQSSQGTSPSKDKPTNAKKRKTLFE